MQLALFVISFFEQVNYYRVTLLIMDIAIHLFCYSYHEKTIIRF